VLGGVSPTPHGPALAAKLVDPTLARAAYFGLHFVGKALAKLGRFDLYYPQLATYRDIVDTSTIN